MVIEVLICNKIILWVEIIISILLSRLIKIFQIFCRKSKPQHLKFMISALTFSFLFLISYLVYHTFHGDTIYEGVGLMRILYFFILISHIFLSAVVLPMVLTTVYFALTGNYAKHPRIARITLPIWLYVSVTGVMIYLILYHFWIFWLAKIQERSHFLQGST